MIERPPLWTLLDGAAAFSFSMLVSLIIQSNQIFSEVWVLRIIKDLTHQNDGLMASTMLLLFPSTAVLYGSVKMIFAAKEAVEKKAREKGREEGREEGREQERLRILDALERDGILDVLERQGVKLPQDIRNGRNGSGYGS